MTDYAVTLDDRILRAIREIIRAEFPQLNYLGTYEYAVQAVHGTDSIDATPVDRSTDAAGKPKYPDIVECPLYPGILGEQVTPVVGALYRIAFIAADPSKPIVVGGDPANPPTLSKLAGGGPAAARTNDAIDGGYLTVGGAAGVTIAWSASGVVSPTTAHVTGKITGGSTKVQIG